MKIAFFSAHKFERDAFDFANQKSDHQITFLDVSLQPTTAKLAQDHVAAVVFVNDQCNRETLTLLSQCGVKLLALRSAGFNHVDLSAAAELGMAVVRVPAYAPEGVAEYAVALVLTLNRQTHRAFARVREGNFSLEGLVGFNVFGKTVGLVGLGKIGKAAARIFGGFGCRVLAHDVDVDQSFAAGLGVELVALPQLFEQADIISLHVPLLPTTRHLVNETSLASMKRGVMLINTGRGALIDTPALIDALKSGQVGSAGLDVYEEEEGLFFADHSNEILQDDVLARLLTFSNVLVTSHQAFLTREALQGIATVTLQNISSFEQGRVENQVPSV